MSEFIKAGKVVSTAIGLLRRQLVLPQLVWTDAKIDPTLSRDDTVTIRIPGYAPARRRALRSGAPRTKDGLFERTVAVKLAVDVYKDVPITDEQLSLDISDFGAQVLNPVLLGVAEQLEQEVYDVIEDTEYEVSLTHDLSSDDAYDTVVDAGLALDDARVPEDGRALVVGSDFARALMRQKELVKVNESGSSNLMRRRMFEDLSGFQIFRAPGLAPNRAIAFHKTAFAMVQRAPLVPAGAPWGASQSYEGLAMRTVRVFDPDEVEDRFITDAWIGTSPVLDDGYFDANGKFIPTTEPGATLGQAKTLATSAAADDIVDTAAPHGFQAGDIVQFTALTGGTGLATQTDYYVIPANLGATSFQVSTTPGGAAATFSADITAGAVAEKARPLMIRALNIDVVQ